MLQVCRFGLISFERDGMSWEIQVLQCEMEGILKLVVAKPLHNFIKMLQMILPVIVKHHDVVLINQDQRSKKAYQDIIHKPLEDS